MPFLRPRNPWDLVGRLNPGFRISTSRMSLRGARPQPVIARSTPSTCHCEEPLGDEAIFGLRRLLHSFRARNDKWGRRGVQEREGKAVTNNRLPNLRTTASKQVLVIPMTGISTTETAIEPTKAPARSLA